MSIRVLAPLTLLLALGCNLSPKLSRPPSTVPETWSKSDKSAAPAASNLHWRDYVTDPGMRSVIELALAHNLDLRVAALNVEKAQATYRIQRGELLPTVGVQGSSTNYRISEKQASSGQSSIYRQNSVYLPGLSWELDFFGRLRNLKDQALNTYLATEQAHAAAQISLVATLAQGYLQYAADAEGLALAQSTLAAQESTHELTARSRELGVAGELELQQARSQVEAARVDVARYRRLVALDRNALELLVGAPVPPELLPKSLGAVGELKDVSAALSSQVLLGRPDILMAEYQLKAANANIGAARAAFFPNISLTAGLGSMSSDVSKLFSAGSGTWLFTPTLTAPIFSGGALRANLRVSQVSRDIAMADYQKAIQSGFREVADGLVQRETLAEQLRAQRSLVEALETSYRLSQARYQAGMDGYLSVLVAQRSLVSAQQGLVTTRLALQANQITLYKALGGKL